MLRRSCDGLCCPVDRPRPEVGSYFVHNGLVFLRRALVYVVNREFWNVRPRNHESV